MRERGGQRGRFGVELRLSRLASDSPANIALLSATDDRARNATTNAMMDAGRIGAGLVRCRMPRKPKGHKRAANVAGKKAIQEPACILRGRLAQWEVALPRAWYVIIGRSLGGAIHPFQECPSRRLGLPRFAGDAGL